MGKRLNDTPEKKRSLFRRLLADNRCSLIAFGCSTLIMIFVYYCFQLFPFGGFTILRMDLYHQYGPLFAELYERIVGARSFLYSWNTGLGGSFLGNFYNYLSSPLSIIVVFFGHKNIPEAIATLILLKAAFASASFSYYLRRTQGRNDALTAAFGVLYAFSGFFIAYYWNVMWLDAMVLFPLALLGIDSIVNHKKPGWFIFALTMTMITNYYMAFMLCLFCIPYFFVSLFTANFDSEKDDTRVIPAKSTGKKAGPIKRLLRSRVLVSGLIFGLSAALSAGLAAFALLPVYHILQSASATSGSFPSTYLSYYKIFDFLANHLANVDPTIRSSGTDVLPNVYCGIATLLLVPLYLFNTSIRLKEKVAHVFLLGFLFFSFNINYANYVWHGFHFPNDLPYRFSFMYSFILLVMAYKAAIRLKEFSGKELLGAGTAVLFVVVLIQELGSKNVNEITILTSLCFVVLYTLLFALERGKRFVTIGFSIMMICSVTAEICIANTDNYIMGQRKIDYVGDYDDFRTVKSALDERTEGFYRMELSNLRARMDPAWFDYNGVSTFSSMANEKLSNLQSRMGMASNFINSYTYNPQTPIYNAMHSLQYVVNNRDETMNPKYYQPLMSKGKFTAYENRYSLPIAFCADPALLNWESSSSNPFMVQGDFFEKATGIPDVFEQIPIVDAFYYNVDEMYSGFDTGQFYFYKTSPDNDASITFVLTPQADRSCYLYVKSSHVDKVNITGGDGYVTKENSREAIIDIGVQRADEELRIELPISEGNSGSIDVYAYALNHALFSEGYEKLRSEALNISVFEDTRILGTVKAKNDCLLFTSIPYDKGWSVRVNGEPVGNDRVVKIGESLLAVKLNAGANAVEFTYMPVGLMQGLYISLASLLLLILLLILKKLFPGKQTVQQPAFPLIHEETPIFPPVAPGHYTFDGFVPEDTPAEDPPQSEPNATQTTSTLFAAEQDSVPAQQSIFDIPAASPPREIIRDEIEIVVEKYDEE